MFSFWLDPKGAKDQDSTHDTRAAIDLTERATAAGAAGILTVTPYYNRPSQAGLLGHFRACAEATDLPVLIYDIPIRTGRKVETDTLLELAHDVDNIIGIKDAAGDPAETALLISQAPADFQVYSGDDSLTLPFAAVGGVGVIGVATHWTGAEHQRMFAALRAGDLATAQKVNAALQASFAYETSNAAPNPIPTKVMMNLLGLNVGRGRPPMDAIPDDLEAWARVVIAETDVGAELGLT